MRLRFGVLATLCAVTLRVPAAEPSVRAWQASLTLPTWEEGAPEAVPTFDILSPGRSWYPYPTRSNLGKQRHDEEWRSLNLENEYLLCTVLPDLGGHVYRCKDKLSGHEMFHLNPSIKKALVGLRGSWAAAGVELNFPLAHSLLTSSPVDFGITQFENSASVWLGATDRQTGMRWVVKLTLQSGSAILRQDVLLENPTPRRHRYLWWANAGITTEPDTRFIMPTHLIAHHGLSEMDTWPRNTAGVDRSVVANYEEGIGQFAHDSQEPFFAAYHPGSRTGTVHYADPVTVPGKKIWTWGNKDDAAIRQQLSDNNSNYVEIQGGLFENQETYGFLAPFESRAFTEYWMPVRQMDGISQTCLDGMLFLERRADNLEVQFLPTHAINGARIEIRNVADGGVTENADLLPAKPYSKTIPNAQPAPYTFRLHDSAGKLLLVFTEGEYRARSAEDVKLGAQPQRDWSHVATPQDYLDRAEYNELQGQFHFAANDYNKALTLFPNNAALLRGAGRLAVETRTFEDGVAYLRRVLALTPVDPETHYYLGLALAGEGQNDDARREWIAVRSDPAYGPLAAFELAAAQARSREFSVAAETLQSALRGRILPREEVLEAALLRSAGDASGAAAALAKALDADPTDLLARYEGIRERAANADPALWEHLAADPERVLEIADSYIHWGLYADALPVLEYQYFPVPANRTEPGSVLPQNDPLVTYYRAYCRERLNQDAGTDYRLASSQSVRLVFPNRPGTLPVLRAAVAQNSSDASAHYLLGLMYLDSGLAREAAAEWQTAQRLRTGFAEALAMLTTVQPALPQAAPPVQPAPPREPQKIQSVTSVISSAPPRAITPSSAPVAATGSPREIALAALANTAAGHLDIALAAFNATNFPQEKQDELVREAYIELQLQHLLAMAAAHQCDLVDRGITTLGYDDKSLPFTFHGFGAFMKGARFQYEVGLVEVSCGGEKLARRRWERVAKMRPDLYSPDFAYPAIAAARLNPAGSAPIVQSALEDVQKTLASATPDQRAALLYSQGLLFQVLGKNEDAGKSLREGVAASPPGMLSYLNALALRTVGGAR